MSSGVLTGDAYPCSSRMSHPCKMSTWTMGNRKARYSLASASSWTRFSVCLAGLRAGFRRALAMCDLRRPRARLSWVG